MVEDQAKSFKSIKSLRVGVYKEDLLDTNSIYDIIFITPECIESVSLKYLKHLNCGLVTLDEVHCIGTWGKFSENLRNFSYFSSFLNFRK